MTQLNCWKCGDNLEWITLPLRRLEACKACGADLHVCRFCEFYDTSFANSCREPIAEKVNDKERANFCGYLKPAPGAYQPDSSAAERSKNDLAALFGDEKPDPDADPATMSRQQLDDLFRKD